MVIGRSLDSYNSWTIDTTEPLYMLLAVLFTSAWLLLRPRGDHHGVYSLLLHEYATYDAPGESGSTPLTSLYLPPFATTICTKAFAPLRTATPKYVRTSVGVWYGICTQGVQVYQAAHLQRWNKNRWVFPSRKLLNMQASSIDAPVTPSWQTGYSEVSRWYAEFMSAHLYAFQGAIGTTC